MKILVRGTNWIGDAVMSIPAMRELRRIFPDAKITLHTRKWAEGLFQDASFVDEIVAFERDRWRIREIYENSQFLREDEFDLAVLLPNSFESALVPFLSRIPKRIGYNKDVRGLLLTDPIAVPEWKNRTHEVYYYLNLVAEIEQRVLGRTTGTRPEFDASLEVSQSRRAGAGHFLEGTGVDLSRPVVGLAVGSTNSNAKRWPVEMFAELIDRLSVECNVNAILLGSGDESEVANRVVALSSCFPIDLTGKTALAEAAAILSQANLIIANDTGLAHVAAAVGTQTLTIFGPTDPETTRPFAPWAEVIREPVECSPCMLRECPIDHRCMTRVTVDRVFDAAKQLLSREE